MGEYKLYSCLDTFGGSQNHRMLEVGRDLCGSSSPTPVPKQGHLEQAAQDLVQAGLEYLQRRRIHSLSGQPVLVLRHPQSEKVLPHVQTELCMLQFPSQPSLLQAKQTQLLQAFLAGEMLQSPHHPRSPPLDSLQ